MPGETEVQTPAAPEVSAEKQEIAAEEAAAAAAEKAKAEEAGGGEKAAKPEEKKKAKAPAPPSVHKKDFEKDVVYLYQFPRTAHLPNVSPYCLKLETWIKLQGIKYENADPQGKFRSKQGLLPFVELNGAEIPDSEGVIASLSKSMEGKDLDAGLADDQAGTAHAMHVMIENHLINCVRHFMSRDATNTIKGYKLNLQTMLRSKLPTPVLLFVFKHLYGKKTTKQLKAAGFGNYSDEEVDNLGKKDLKVLSDLLGDKQFFFGDEPRLLDVRAFAVLAMILCLDKEVAFPLRDFAEEECKNLVGLFNRIKDRAWGEHWDMATGESLEQNPHIPKPEPPKEEEKKEAEKKEEDKKEDKEEEKKDDAKEKDNKEAEEEENK